MSTTISSLELQIFIASSRIQSYLLLSINLIWLDALPILFPENSMKTSSLFVFLYCVSWILFIRSLLSAFTIALKGATFVVECSLSFLFIINTLIDSSKFYFPFVCIFAEIKKNWAVPLNASTAPWCWGYKILYNSK